MALRTSLVAQPHLYIGDTTGRPLDGGKVYFGQVNKDPELYPINVFYDEGLSIPAAQPVRTKGGFMYANGDMAEIYAAETRYSVRVLDSYGRQVFYKPDMQSGLDVSNEIDTIEDMIALYAPTNGLRVYVKSYYAGLNKGGGYFTYDSSKSAINDGGAVINGWVRPKATVINASMFGAVGSEVDSVSEKLQAAINYLKDGGVLDLEGGVYTVKKNKALEGYPGGDQPCLAVKNTKGLLIKNGTLIVKEHGQGILDVINSTARIENVKLVAPKNFPPLYSNSGRGEKGLEDAGYWHPKMADGITSIRNNALDTSGYTTGNYGSQGFPQWGGGFAPTWGMWNGGYIASEGNGIWSLDSDTEVIGCDISGFNGNGVVAGGGNIVTVKNCKIHDIYSAGVYFSGSYEFTGKALTRAVIENNDIYNIGHPDVSRSDLLIDPGYGIASGNKSAGTKGVVEYIVRGNNIKNCKRKGIDAHHGTLVRFEKNNIEQCASGIELKIYDGTWTDLNPYLCYICDNNIRDIRGVYSHGNRAITIEPFGKAGRYLGKTHVTNNVINNCAQDVDSTLDESGVARVIDVMAQEYVLIANNTITNPKNTRANIAITSTTNNEGASARCIIMGNYIRGAYDIAILSTQNADRAYTAVWGKTGGAVNVIGNLIDMEHFNVASGGSTEQKGYAIATGSGAGLEGNTFLLGKDVLKYPSYTKPSIGNIVFVWSALPVASGGSIYALQYGENSDSNLLTISTATEQSGDLVTISFNHFYGNVKNFNIRQATLLKSGTVGDISIATDRSTGNKITMEFMKPSGTGWERVSAKNLTAGSLVFEVSFRSF